MRLWSIHPKYLDTMGLCGLWREALLAQEVLTGRTEKYKNHPQLERFKTKNGIKYINEYLYYIWCEACDRGYNFDLGKIIIYPQIRKKSIKITKGQLNYEFKHLQNKLNSRDQLKMIDNYNLFDKEKIIESHPLFKVIKGDIESWEKIK